MRVVQVYENYTRISVTNSWIGKKWIKKNWGERERERREDKNIKQSNGIETTTMHATIPQNDDGNINIIDKPNDSV